MHLGCFHAHSQYWEAAHDLVINSSKHCFIPSLHGSIPASTAASRLPHLCFLKFTAMCVGVAVLHHITRCMGTHVSVLSGISPQTFRFTRSYHTILSTWLLVHLIPNDVCMFNCIPYHDACSNVRSNLVRKHFFKTDASNYTQQVPLRVLAGTYNVNGKKPPPNLDLKEWLGIFVSFLL